jgi:drug/metabolite transporter (DMT)-like permease
VPLGLLLPVVLVSFAVNSLVTRHVVDEDLLDPGLLTCVRFLAGAAALLGLALSRGERVRVGRANAVPALWLGAYAVCISYGYQHIGAAAGTLVFYATVLLTLVGHDLVRRVPVARRRLLGAGVALTGVAVLADPATGTVTALGVALLAATGASWGLYTSAGRTATDPRVATTGHFALLALPLLPWTGALAAGGARVTGEGLAWAALMGAGTTAFAYVAWYACQRALSATAAGTVQLVIPVLTAVGAVALLDEPLTVRLVVAGALVALGMERARPTSAR